MRSLANLGIGMMVFGTAILGAQINAHAAYFALVIGIDRYAVYENLQGAVNDARDIRRALLGFGAKSVTMLLNEQASKRNIAGAWDKLVRRAQPGDTLVLTYSGHGSQEAEAVAGSEEDGKDETFLLGRFDPKDRNNAGERIVDNEINAWFARAGKKNLKVIFIADACYSGTMTRSLDGRVKLTWRQAPPYELPDDMPITEDTKKGAMLGEDALEHVVFLAATQEHRRSPEVPIEGKMRGALSWAFARALEGQADSNRDGETSRYELEDFIIPVVRQKSQALQTPEVLPRAMKDDILLTRGGPEAGLKRDQTGPRLDQAAEGDLLPLRIAVLNLDAGQARDIVDRINQVEFAGPGMTAELIWDAEERSVISATGDVIANNVSKAELPRIVGKWRTLEAIRTLARAAPLRMYMQPDDRRFREGQKIRFRSAPLKFPWLTVFNIASNGEVQYIPPGPRETGRTPIGASYKLELKVVPPFGADHLVLVASERSLPDLHNRLRRAGSAELLPVLKRALKDVRHQIGIQPLYTGRQ